MQIDIDFEVFKALTALRESESDSHNAVIRRILGLATTANALAALASPSAPIQPGGSMASLTASRSSSAFQQMQYGVWYGDVHLPEGTRFRATYKGQTHFGQIVNGQWVDSEGIIRSSPSDAASAISNTNVNGWRFWHVKLPGDPAWRKLDELKR